MKKAKETEIRAEVENLRSLDKDDLRARWCKTFGKEPPPALTKDLLGRMIAWRIQEKFYGGHDKATIKLCSTVWPRGEAAKLEAGPRLKPGTVLMLIRRRGRALRASSMLGRTRSWCSPTVPPHQSTCLLIASGHCCAAATKSSCRFWSTTATSCPGKGSPSKQELFCGSCQ